MKTFAVLATAVAAVLASCPPAGAQSIPSGAYVQADVGAGLAGRFRARGEDVLLGPLQVGEDLKRGWTADVLVGRRLGARPLAIEGEALYVNAPIKSGDLDAAVGASLGLRDQTLGALANLKLEQPLAPLANGLVIAPYVAAGAGWGRSSVTILGDHYKGDGAMWQVKAGLALQTSRSLAWTLGYRYLVLPTFDINQNGLAARLKTETQSVSVGVRYTFGG